MAVIVSILGVLVAAIGLMGIVQPRRIIDLVEYWRGPTRFRLAIVVRLVLGCVLLVVAPTCRLPIVVNLIGAIAIVAAVVIRIVGQKRLDSFIAWWLAHPPALIRLSVLFAVAFGVLLVYAGA